MAKTAESIDQVTLVSLAKQVALKSTPLTEITDIIYSFDEEKILSINEQNKLLRFVHDTNIAWQRPKGMGQMVTEILRRVGQGEREKPRYGQPGPANRDEITAIYNWVMDPKRK